MFEIHETTFEEILKRRFRALYGTLCEQIEDLEKLNLSTSEFANRVKKDVKKDIYNAMREIRDQVDSFSKGVRIAVDFNRPASQ